jgi:hypothetical protein
VSEWTPYKIRIPKSSGTTPDQGQPLETVYHVVHVPTALRILEDGCLRGGLIYDESRLRKSRICVTWLSANTWGPGSIYGNVQFAFLWAEQIRNRRCYWVEAMRAYSPPAYRILLTDRDLSDSKYVQEYDPSSNRGPLRERDGVWYWNSRYISEFMVEGDVELEQCTGFDFIHHHSSICRLNGGGCSDFSAAAHLTGGKVMAFLLGHDLHSVDHVLKRTKRLSTAADVGIEGIIRALGGKRSRFGGVVKSSASRKSILRGALALYSHGKTNAARNLVALLKSQAVFETALSEIVSEHFKIRGWTAS